MAPSDANVFTRVLEKNMLATAPQGKTPLFYKRFIDDVFGIGAFRRGGTAGFFLACKQGSSDYQLHVPFWYRSGLHGFMIIFVDYR